MKHSYMVLTINLLEFANDCNISSSKKAHTKKESLGITLASIERQKVTMRPSMRADLMTVLVDIFDIFNLIVDTFPCNVMIQPV